MQDYSRISQVDLRRKANEAIPLMGRRVQAFRDTLASYLIPADAVEKYAIMFMHKKE